MAASKHTHTLPQCSRASVGHAQARPNYKYLHDDSRLLPAARRQQFSLSSNMGLLTDLELSSHLLSHL